MRRSVITAAAVVAVAAGAGVALAEDPPKPVKAPVERPGLAMPHPAVLHAGGPLPAEPHPFGLHRELAEDMAKDLGLPADRVAEAMRKAIGAQFDRRRDEALQCFDDRDECKAARLVPPILPRDARPVPVPVRPGRTTRP